MGIAGYLADVTGGVKRELQRSISQSQTGEKVSGLTRQDKTRARKLSSERAGLLQLYCS